jgi:SAM-dependent methyltransferase
MDAEQYESLADVYEWLIPEPLLEPEWSAAAFSAVIDELPAGARVLDCACGTGELAVGLALRGVDVTATDASAAMVRRTGKLAAERGVEVQTRVCAWEELPAQGWDGAFDAVFCVGNSLAHAPGAERRRAALGAMAGTLRAGGLLALTSRNWEREREGGSRVEVFDRLVRRHGRDGLVIYAWTIADAWEARHDLEIAVALLGEDGAVRTTRERLEVWPFARETLDADLRAAGLEPESSTWREDAERYLVTARR